MSSFRPIAGNYRGFTIIEVVIAITLVGILSVFLGFFVGNFVSGYFFTRANSEAALKAQVALDRMAIELKDMRTVTNVADNNSITFTNSSGAARTIRYINPRINLTVDGTDWELLDGVIGFTLSALFDNMDGVVGAKEEVAHIDIGYNLGGIPAPFTARVFPRNMVSQP